LKEKCACTSGKKIYPDIFYIAIINCALCNKLQVFYYAQFRTFETKAP